MSFSLRFFFVFFVSQHDDQSKHQDPEGANFNCVASEMCLFAHLRTMSVPRP